MEGRFVSIEEDFHDIEAEEDVGMIEQAQPGERATRNELLLIPRHRLAGRAEAEATPRLDFYEDERVARPIPTDDVHLAPMRRAIIAVEHTVALPPQVTRGQSLAKAAKFSGVQARLAGREEKIGDESDKVHACAV